MLNPIQRYTVVGMEGGYCTIDGNRVTVECERRLRLPEFSEPGDDGCVNAKNSMANYEKGTNCSEVLKYPSKEGSNALVTVLMTWVVVFVAVELRDKLWIRFHHTEKYSWKGGPSRANLCFKNDGVEVNARAPASVGEHGSMRTVLKARLTAEQLLKGRVLRLCVSRYRLAVNRYIVSSITWPFSAENPYAGA